MDNYIADWTEDSVTREYLNRGQTVECKCCGAEIDEGKYCGDCQYEEGRLDNGE